MSTSFDVIVIAPQETPPDDLVVENTVSVGVATNSGSVGTAATAMTNTTSVDLDSLVRNINASLQGEPVSSVMVSGPLSIAGDLVETTSKTTASLNSLINPTGAVGLVCTGFTVPGGSSVLHSVWVGDHEDYTPLEEGDVSVQGNLTVEGELNLSGPLNVPGLMPVGAIIMWYGTLAQIPSGWRVCDGTGGTPNFSGKFPRGTIVDGDVGVLGGADEVVLVPDQLAPHTHTGTTSVTGNHNHNTNFFSGQADIFSADIIQFVQGNNNLPNGSLSTTNDGNHSHSFTTNSTGLGDPIPILPTYCQVMYIMRVF